MKTIKNVGIEKAYDQMGIDANFSTGFVDLNKGYISKKRVHDKVVAKQATKDVVKNLSVLIQDKKLV